MCQSPTDAQKRISFGSCQERKIFPLHHAPDRLGVHVIAISGNPALGPGCYLSQELAADHLKLDAEHLGMVCRTNPAAYQSLWKKERKCQPAYAPFSIKTPRFPDKPSDKEFFPGPGTYEADKRLHKKITWPMKFGSPDWSLVPMPAKRMLKMELTVDKEYRKHRDRVAYLSLYYS
uniref:Protein pitchfork n=1 Tax=Calidris pygmaea TaxID=425635 RepID=A0A8C3PIG0_9CHAR